MTPLKENVSPCPYCGTECLFGYGFCHCGCGRIAPAIQSTDHSRNLKKGNHFRFIKGHNNIKPRKILGPESRFKIDEVYCRLIPLTCGLWTIVWESDYDWLMQWFWCVRRDKQGKYYATRGAKPRDGERIKTDLHQALLQVEKPLEIDHVNGNTLDNRRSNLRPANRIQQTRNRSIYRNSTTRCKGVSIDKRKKSNPFIAYIQVDKRRIRLGAFPTLEAANAIRLAAEQKYFGEYARKA